MPPPSLLIDTSPDDVSRQFQMSRALIDHYLNWGFKVHPTASVKISTRIQRALREVTDLREQPGRSTNLQLRNAEYYLHGLYASVSGDLTHMILTSGAELYDQLKSVAVGTPLEQLMRTDANNPNSPPGGADWALKGLQDGRNIRDTETAGRSGGHNLPIPSR